MKEAFALSNKDMMYVDLLVITYKLQVNLSFKLVKQNRRMLVSKRNTIINKEVQKLLRVELIHNVWYPDWLVNVMVVKKNYQKIVCMDFNKVFLKEHFFLSYIDKLFDVTTILEMISFMDDLSGYNQILMNKENQEKTNFITKLRYIFLRGYTFWIEKCWIHLPAFHQQNVWSADEIYHGGLHWRHINEITQS